jgi:hypothetical protein
MTNLKTLDDLVALAERYAEHNMQTSGTQPVTLFLLNSDGLSLLKSSSLAGEAGKEYFAAVG